MDDESYIGDGDADDPAIEEDPGADPGADVGGGRVLGDVSSDDAGDDAEAASEPGTLLERVGPTRLALAALGLVTVFALVAVAVASSAQDDTDDTVAGAAPTLTTAAPPTTRSAADASTSTIDASDDSTTVLASTTTPPAVTVPDVPTETAPPQDDESPAVVARPIPVDPPPPPPEAPPPPWAASYRTTEGGHLSTDVGCVDDLSRESIDTFLAGRVGPVLGWDYQHVYPLGGDRHLWLFQDTFVDHSGTASTLGASGFVHNMALVQEGTCFRLLHRGDTDRPEPFELGTGSRRLQTWFWPMGGEVHGGELHVVWAQMTKDAFDPQPPDGLGWHPVATWIATYEPATMRRTSFRAAPNPWAVPIYGYAMASDETHTYLFGNTFEQNLSREGGYWNGPHSGTLMFLARVPRGQLFSPPEYWSPDGWSGDPAASAPFEQRHWAEFPMQPRYIDGQWVAIEAVNGYWGDQYRLDVANDPWGPWTTVRSEPLLPRGFDPLMNTYHAHLLPWRDANGQLIASVSNNARNMLRDAWPNPSRYRPMLFTAPWVPAPQRPPPTTTTTSTTTTTTVPPSTTTTTTTTTVATTTTTTVPPTTTTTTVPPSTTTTTTTPSTSTTEPTTPAADDS